MQRELQEAWAGNRVVDHAQATRRGNLWRTFEIGKEGNVVVRGVEIGMVENIKCVGFELQLEALFDQELLGQAHVEADLEWASKTVPACRSKQGFIEIGPATVGNGNAVGPRSHELGSEIGHVELTECRRNSRRAISAPCCLLGGYAR